MLLPSRRPVTNSVQKRVGLTIGDRYRLKSVIGVGSAGAVYAATTIPPSRDLAIKVLHPEFMNNPEIVERFRREAAAPNRIRLGDGPHPNVVPILDAGRSAEHGFFYMVQRLLKGETLDSYIARSPNRRVSLAETVTLTRPIIDAVATAHEMGVVHRDLKPSNIFLVERPASMGGPSPRILDFGVAQYSDQRMTVSDRILGTPQYMSPESFLTPRQVDGRVDVWAFGVMLYEMLSGIQPFDIPGADWMAICVAVCQESPEPLASLGVAPRVAAVIERCLQKDRANRWPDARALQDALDSVVA